MLPGEPSVPVHAHSIDYEVFDGSHHLSVVGHLRDTRPWAIGTASVSLVHDMELRVTVRIADLCITESDALMHAFPHTECPGILLAFHGLTGLQVSRGYTGQVQKLFGGPRGCSHLEHLARSLGPVVVQAVTSKKALAVACGESSDLIDGTDCSWIANTCHVWSEDGVAEQKLAVGWRPGKGDYPAPTLESLRRAGLGGCD
ncbi:MAG: DUF2889 domain-containing protein [Acidimicrobiales bacterium]